MNTYRAMGARLDEFPISPCHESIVHIGDETWNTTHIDFKGPYAILVDIPGYLLEMLSGR